MNYRQIGTTGIQVSALGLGAMPLSIEGRPKELQAIQVIETFLDLGGNFIDTANVYCLDDGDIGHNERLVRCALIDLGKGDKVVVATKGGLRRPRGGWVTDGSPAPGCMNPASAVLGILASSGSRSISCMRWTQESGCCRPWTH